MLLTLSDLRRLRATNHASIQPLPKVYPDDQPTTAQLQERLQLLIHQHHLKLPIQPLLDNDPLLKRLMQDVQTALPQCFRPKKRLRLHTAIAAPLMIAEDPIYIEVTVNLGFRRGNPKLLEWALRKPDLTWSDRVKLWVITKHFDLQPEAVKLIVVALRRHRPTQTVVYRWHRLLHKQTERWLQQLVAAALAPQPAPSMPMNPVRQTDLHPFIDLEAIEEVPL